MRISAALNERLEEVWRRVGYQLRLVWLQFGAGDFPGDQGKSYRNDLFSFCLGFKSELRKPDETDPWFQKNMPLFESLTTEQLIHVIGTLHFYAVAREMTRANESRETSLHILQIALDWIMNTYGASDEATVEWFEVVKSALSGGVFMGQEKMYAEIARVIGADPTDEINSNCWGGMAFILRHRGAGKSHSAWCEEIFKT